MGTVFIERGSLFQEERCDPFDEDVKRIDVIMISEDSMETRYWIYIFCDEVHEFKLGSYEYYVGYTTIQGSRFKITALDNEEVLTNAHILGNAKFLVALSLEHCRQGTLYKKCTLTPWRTIFPMSLKRLWDTDDDVKNANYNGIKILDTTKPFGSLLDEFSDYASSKLSL